MAVAPLALTGRDKTTKSEHLERRHRDSSLFTHIVVVSLVVFGALRFVLEKFWLGQLSSADNFSLFLKSSPSSSTFNKRILVVLPMMGLKKTGLIENDVVTEERLAIQSWNLLAEHLAAANPSHSPNGPLRVLGMVGALSECDPWLYRFMNPNRYACQVLPVECLQTKYDDIPMLNCLLETAVNEAKRSGEELVLFANGDVSFALELLDVVSSIYGDDSILMNNTTKRGAGSHVVVVGQRTDVEVALDNPLSLTRQALIDLHSQAKAEGSLHQDFGIDYFIFPLEALPRRFPPFLVGRFRWDNALLATFLMQGATTVDATKTLSVVHFGVHASDTAHHAQRLGAGYNDELVRTYYNKAFMLGRISNTGWIHQASTETRDDKKPSYLLMPREAPTDADLLRAFQMATFDSHANSDTKGTKMQRNRKLSAGGASEYPNLLLIAVSQQQELTTLVEHSTVNSQSIPAHAMFLTKDPEIHAGLDLHFGSRTFLERKVNWSSPAASIEWHTFGRLLTNSIAVMLTNASAWVESSERPSPLLEHPDWNLRTGDVALHPQDLEQVVGIRPTKTGLAFWEAYRDCHSGKRREEMMKIGNLSALGDWPSRHHQDQVQTPLTKVQCLEAIRETFAIAIHEKPSSKPFSRTLKMQGGVPAENLLNPTLSNVRKQEENIYDQSLGNVSADSPPTYLPTLRKAQNRLDQVRWALEDTSACNKSSIPEKLHMVLTITNPGMYASRYILARDFIQRIARHDSAHVELYIVECAYDGQPFNMTQASNPRHLQVRASTPLWHKENLINVAVARLLPPDWQALAWVDAEIEFESPTWALDALHLLLHVKAADIIQLFSFAEDLGDKSETVHVYTGFIYNYVKQIAYQKKGTDLWHPGYAWGCSRRAYEQVGGLFEGNILGGGDQCTAYALLGMHAQLPDTLKLFPSKGYKEAVFAWEDRFKGLRMGYVPGVIQHHYHGSVKDRKYWERRDLLSDAGFDPQTHVARDEVTGVLVPTAAFPPGLAAGILDYFQSRKEDAITGLEPQALTFNPTHDAIANNEPLRGPLPVIIVVPPGPFPTAPASQGESTEPETLIRHYLDRFHHQNPKDVDLYLVEVARSADGFRFTSSGNPRHLQHVAVDTAESGIKCSGHHLRNLAVRELLPATWEAMAWVDIGAELESRTWARDALRLLNQNSYDAVQLFSHTAETDAWGNTTNIWSGFGYNHGRGVAYESDPARKDSSWYPGGGWAYSRRAFDAGPGLVELSTDEILREDEIQAKCLVGLYSSSGGLLEASALKSEANWKNVRVGYVPGVFKQWTPYTNLLGPPM